MENNPAGRLIRKENMGTPIKVAALVRYGTQSATSRIRFEQYAPFFAQEDIRMELHPLLNNPYLTAFYNGHGHFLPHLASAYLRRARALPGICRHADVLWIEKELFPFLPAWLEAMLLRNNTSWVLDYDDATFHSYDSVRNPILRHLLKDKIGSLMRRAAGVTAGNEYLADYARVAAARRVEVLPSVIDLAHYSVRQARENVPVVIGWIGSPSTSRYLEEIQPTLADVCKGDRARLVVMGTQHGFSLKGVPVETRNWALEQEVSTLLSFDIGIMPLEDSAWGRGKCGYKLIQYMACALPVVGSSIGVNRTIIKHGKNGFTASSAKEWKTALTTLCDDWVLRKQMGLAGRKSVEENYCVQKTWPLAVKVLREAATGNGQT